MSVWRRSHESPSSASAALASMAAPCVVGSRGRPAASTETPKPSAAAEAAVRPASPRRRPAQRREARKESFRRESTRGSRYRARRPRSTTRPPRHKHTHKIRLVRVRRPPSSPGRGVGRVCVLNNELVTNKYDDSLCLSTARVRGRCGPAVAQLGRRWRPATAGRHDTTREPSRRRSGIVSSPRPLCVGAAPSDAPSPSWPERIPRREWRPL
jgi:hypothetical protein